jgi:Uma2 family endonuclease
MTFAEFAALQEIEGKCELLDGELIILPPAKRRHAQLARRIRRVLEGLVKDADHVYQEEMGYRITFNPDSWFVPDVSVQFPDQKGDDYFEGAPMLAVEVISESNTARALQRKIRRYLTNGASEVCVVYPDTHTIWVHRPDGTAREFTDKLESTLFPGQPILLDPIWA